MKRASKPIFFIVVVLILVMSFLSFFGIKTENGDLEKIIIKGAQIDKFRGACRQKSLLIAKFCNGVFVFLKMHTCRRKFVAKMQKHTTYARKILRCFSPIFARKKCSFCNLCATSTSRLKLQAHLQPQQALQLQKSACIWHIKVIKW